MKVSAIQSLDNLKEISYMPEAQTVVYMSSDLYADKAWSICVVETPIIHTKGKEIQTVNLNTQPFYTHVLSMIKI